MKIYLTSAYDEHATLDVLRNLVTLDSVKIHQTTDSPEEADIILFVENAQFDDYLYRRLCLHPLVIKYRSKVFMFNEVDKPWAALPGLYASMPKRYFQENRQAAFGFFKTPNDFVKDIFHSNQYTERQWLFSFVGAVSHRCRKPIIELSKCTPSVQDTSGFDVWHCSADTKAVQGSNYADIMARSEYVLCPRGLGTSSFRLFEAMEAGRAPVIISNQWVAPGFVNWDFALRVAEHEINRIPQFLSSRRDEARDRGLAARAEWEQAFAPEKLFHSMAEAVGRLYESRNQTTRKVYFQNIRKVLIESELKLVSTARKVRGRLQGFSPDRAI